MLHVAERICLNDARLILQRHEEGCITLNIDNCRERGRILEVRDKPFSSELSRRLLRATHRIELRDAGFRANQNKPNQGFGLVSRRYACVKENLTIRGQHAVVPIKWCELVCRIILRRLLLGIPIGIGCVVLVGVGPVQETVRILVVPLDKVHEVAYTVNMIHPIRCNGIDFGATRNGISYDNRFFKVSTEYAYCRCANRCNPIRISVIIDLKEGFAENEVRELITKISSQVIAETGRGRILHRFCKLNVLSLHSLRIYPHITRNGISLPIGKYATEV